MMFNTKSFILIIDTHKYTSTMRLNFFKAFALLFTLSSITFINAATWTWVGGTSTSWDLKANWSTVSGASRPQNGDDVIINAGAVNQPRLVNNRTVRTLTLNGGTFDTRTHNLTINNTLYLNGGDITNSQAFNTGNIYVDDIELNASGVVSLNSIGTLNIYVYNSMTFSSGILETNNDDYIIFEDNATASGFSDQSHVNGPVRKRGNDAFVYPIGNGSFLAPLGISDFSNSSTTQHHTAEYSYTAPAGSLNGGGALSQRETWSLQRSQVNRTTRITLFFNQHQRSGEITDSTDLVVAVNDGTTWNPINVTLSGNSSVGSITTTTRVSGVIQGLTIGSPLGLNPLPVELVSLNAKPELNNIRIDWTTANEINNDFFTVEKSIDGKVWFEIGTVKAAANSEVINNYQLIDNNPYSGTQYYRVKQSDFNGQSKYFDVVKVDFKTNVSSIKLYPNPTVNNINVNLNVDENVDANINVIDAMGKTVIEMKGLNGTEFSVDLSSISTGVYFIEIVYENQIIKTQFIKN